MSEVEQMEKVTGHVKRVLEIVGIPTDGDVVEKVTSLFSDAAHRLSWGGRHFPEDYFFLYAIDALATETSNKSDEERSKAKDRVRGAIRHTLQTRNLKLDSEQIKYVEENVLDLLERIAQEPSFEYERLYSDFEYYKLGLSDEGSASASASG